VTETECNLAVGCGHGHFSRPTVRADGTFDVDGTYRIEAGPISIDPAPPAHFWGSLTGSRLILNVMPSGSLPPASYAMTPTTGGTCPIPMCRVDVRLSRAAARPVSAWPAEASQVRLVER
jgi:hypothetical protein